MKFTWFSLMPWPYLGDDFREKNRSVWVDVPNTLYDPIKGHDLYNDYLVENSRRFGTAGKILFPIPDRGLAERLYCVKAPTALIWGESDRLIPACYENAFLAHPEQAKLTSISKAGHMVLYEQTEKIIATSNNVA